MAVPRPLLLALLGVVLLSATFFATRNARERTDSAKPAAEQQQAPKAANPHKSASASQARSGAAKSAPSAARPAHRSSGVAKAAAVSRAIAHRRMVVLAFFQPGADDRASAAAVSALRGTHGVAVFTDRIGHVGRYGPLVQGIGIDQAPAIVIVDRDRRARLIQGYVDPETLAQEVSDARG
jgi:hypothetical protein